jgi:hypothetical protein
MSRALDADYLVVGAGAMGMAFTDALIDHDPKARVAVVDRRHGPGGHWVAAYPFVRLHQSSDFYGMASTRLGGGQLQQRGPEAGLQERATQPEILSYFGRGLDRMTETGRVDFLFNSEYADGAVTSFITGRRLEVSQRTRIVDSHYLSPTIPAEMPLPFAVADGARVATPNRLAQLEEAPSEYVVVGSGKTATDAIVWLLGRGVDPDAICWIRPRDPWMLNRAVIQPDPAIYTAMMADLFQASAEGASLDDIFLRLEDAGVMLRIDRSVAPTMAKAPTLATWELDLLRTVENVVRRGYLREVARGRLTFDDGSIEVADDALVVHCAADGLKVPPRIPIWQPDVITLQTIRIGFPTFGAALAGYVEATRTDDAEKNRICPPNNYGNTFHEWARMNAQGLLNVRTFSAEPDIADWLSGISLNPTRVPPGYTKTAELEAARQRLAQYADAGIARIFQLSY